MLEYVAHADRARKPELGHRVGIIGATDQGRRVTVLPAMIRIKEFRKAQGLTQVQLAEMAGISRSHLAEMEAGTRPINSVRVAQIAKALGVAESALFEQDAEKATALAELVALARRADPQDVEILLQVARGMARRQDTEQDQKAS